MEGSPISIPSIGKRVFVLLVPLGPALASLSKGGGGVGVQEGTGGGEERGQPE